LGEMPEQQAAGLQILGQLQSQLQLEGDALARAEQQKNMLQTMTLAAPVVDLDDNVQSKPSGASGADGGRPAGKPDLSAARAQLAALLARGYTDKHPTVRKVRAQI